MKALFLDRDGTLMADPGYTGDPDAVSLLPYTITGLKAFINAGFLPIIVTNQSAIARGYFPPSAVEAVNQRVVSLLARHEIQIADVFYCPHHPDDQCQCRKPQPGMLIAAAQRHAITLEDSIMIGDKLSDVQAGHAAGCAHAILVSTDPHLAGPETVPHLNAAAALILGNHAP